MATKRRSRRRSTTARRKTTNPYRRRSASLVHRHSTAPLRRRNPRRRQHRRRNPTHATGLLAQGITLAAGAALVQFTLAFIPPIGGVSPLADAARTAAVGWGLGALMDKTGVGKAYARDVTLAGFTLAGGKLISSFILPFANRLFTTSRPTQASNGQAQGVQGIAAYRPGLNPFGAYGNGMKGIATLVPGQQPFGSYVPVA